MLYLSGSSSAPQLLTAKNDFSAQAIALGMTFVDGTNVLNNTTTDVNSLLDSNTKIIIIAVVGDIINSTNMSEITTILDSRPDISILAFIDGCCNPSTNLQPLISAINSDLPAEWTPFSLASSPYGNGGYTAYLNTNSLYQAPFASAGLTTVTGNETLPINNVPVDYAMYTEANVPTGTTGLINSTIGLFLPHAAINAGNGACMFLMTDSNELLPTTTGITVTATQIANLAAVSVSMVNSCALPLAGAHAAPTCTAAPNPASPTQTVTLTCTGTTGDILTIPGSTCTTAAAITFDSTGNAQCIGLGSALGNNPTATATDPSSNVLTAPVPLQIISGAAAQPPAVPALRNSLIALLGVMLAGLGSVGLRRSARR